MEIPLRLSPPVKSRDKVIDESTPLVSRLTFDRMVPRGSIYVIYRRFAGEKSIHKWRLEKVWMGV